MTAAARGHRITAAMLGGGGNTQTASLFIIAKAGDNTVRSKEDMKQQRGTVVLKGRTVDQLMKHCLRSGCGDAQLQLEIVFLLGFKRNAP